jgi:alpha-beta hydrolase superfamily lysophospholipase
MTTYELLFVFCVQLTVSRFREIGLLAVLLCHLTEPPNTHLLSSNPQNQSLGRAAAVKIELLKPTGPFSIGTKIYEWVDSSRTERASTKTGEFRSLIVQVWYPAKKGATPVAPYVPRLEAYRRVWEPKDVEVAGRVLTHAHLDEEPLSGRQFPVVLLSHGWQGTRTEYTSLAEDLASHGFAVFGIDHPYMGRIALSNGQVTESTEDQFANQSEIREYYGQDVEFVIDQIMKLNVGDPVRTFTGKLEVSKIGAIGHSSGFVAAATACMSDQRIAACANVDAPGYSASDLRALRQPLLWLRLNRAGPLLAEFLKDRSEPSYELLFKSANHSSVEDWDYIEAESDQQRDSAAEQLRILRKYLAAFFSEYLQGHEQTLLKKESSSSDVIFQIHAGREVSTTHRESE